MANRLKFLTETILNSYSLLFFSHSKVVGICLILSTMLFPKYGAFALVGTILTNVFARVLDIDKEYIKKGIYGFQGILLGLSVSSIWGINLQSLFILFISSILLTLTTYFFNNVFYYYLSLPSMTVPFAIVNMLLILASKGLPTLSVTLNSIPIYDLQDNVLPYWITIFLKNLSSLIYQPNILGGLLITLGILFYSRILLLLIITGFTFGAFLHYLLGVDTALLEKNFLGYNYMILTLAISGVYTIPTLSSLLISLLAVSTAAIILLAIYYNPLFSAFVFPYAFPIIIPLLLVLYGLRFRVKPIIWSTFKSLDIYSPEQNLINYLKEKDRISVSLPFLGKWKVTQGEKEDLTHIFNLRHAYDFQAVDSNGKTYKNQGDNIEDYFSYGQPVLAPASGKVLEVKNYIEDNKISKVNTAEPWGNYIIIEHLPNLYSCIIHFKKGSIAVKTGEIVTKGQLLGFCGNSGKSIRPHIHFQLQASKTLGAPSLPIVLEDIFVYENDTKNFFSRTKIKKDQIVKNANYIADFENYFPYMLNNESKYLFNDKTETWKSSIDYYNNIVLVSSPNVTKIHFELTSGKLTIKKIEGAKNTGLYLFSNLVTEVFFLQATENVTLNPNDSKVSSNGFRNILLKPIFSSSSKRMIEYSLNLKKGEIVLLDKTRFSEIVFKSNIGLHSIKIQGKEKLKYIGPH